MKDLLSSFGDLKALHLVIDPLSGVSKVGRSDDVGADICGGQAVPCSLALVERGLEDDAANLPSTPPFHICWQGFAFCEYLDAALTDAVIQGLNGYACGLSRPRHPSCLVHMAVA